MNKAMHRNGWIAQFSITVQIVVMLFWPAIAVAGGPTPPTVTGGAGAVSQQGNTTTIRQTSQYATFTWKNGLTVDVNHILKFVQPNSLAVALNKDISGNASSIMGTLLANGRVFIMNSNGIIFGKDSKVDVAGILATTFNVDTTDFMKGKLTLEQRSAQLASITNHGVIRVSEGGFVFLIAPTVENDNLIIANLGQVRLDAGQKYLVDFRGDGLITYELSGAAVNSLTSATAPQGGTVINNGKIQANGGTIDLQGRLVQNPGRLEAQSIRNHKGVITLDASDPVANKGLTGPANNLGKVHNALGDVLMTGTIDVSSSSAFVNAGQVTITGQHIGVSGSILANALNKGNGGSVLLNSTNQTLLTTTAKIDVSATGQGNGGNAVIWSDLDTRFQGTITGTSVNGKGADVEVSGHRNLDFSGRVNLLSQHEVNGTLLLDPATVSFQSGVGNDPSDGAGGTVNFFQGTPSATFNQMAFADVGPTTIFQSQLQGATGNIIVSATTTINSIAAAPFTALIPNNTNITLQTQGTAGSINLGGAGAMSIQTQGTGTISILGNTTNAAGAYSVTLAGLTSAGGSITVNALGASTVSFGNVSTSGGNLITNHQNASQQAATTINLGTGILSDDCFGGTDTFTNAGNVIANVAIRNTAVGAASVSVSTGGAMTTANGGIQNGITTLGGAMNTTLTAAGALTVAAASAVATGGGTLSLQSTGANVVLNGTVSASSTVINGSTGINLNVAGASVTTTGAQTYTGAVTLGATQTLAAGALVSFSSTINSDALLTPRGLTINDAGFTVTFSGAVGSTFPLSSIAVTATTINLNAAGGVTTSGALGQVYTGAVVLGASMTLTATGGGPVNFSGAGSTINADASANNRSLTVTDVAGATTFGGAVGGVQNLASLTASATTISAQAISLNGATSPSGLNFSATTSSTLNGNIAFTGDSAGNQTMTFTGPVLIATNGLTLTGAPAPGGGGGASDDPITFNGTVNPTGAGITFNINNINTPDVAGGGSPVIFNAAVGGITPFAALNVSGGQIGTASRIQLNSVGGVQTTGNQTWTGPVQLGASLSLISTGGGTIQFAIGGNANQTGTINGGFALIVNANGGTATFGGAVGNSTALTSLAVTANTAINLNAAGGVTTTGGQSYTGPVTYSTSQTLTGAGLITFSSTIADSLVGRDILTITDPGNTVNFTGAVGTTAVGGLTITNAATVTLSSSVTTSTANGGTGNFTQTTGTGTTTLNGGTIAGALSISTNAIVLNGGVLAVTGTTGLTATSGNISDNGGLGILQCTAAATLATTGGTGNISLTNGANLFNGTLNVNTAGSAGNASITSNSNVAGVGIDLTGANVIAGNLTLTALSGSVTNVAGTSLTVTGNASFTGTSVNLNVANAMVAFTSGSLTFSSAGAVAINQTGATTLSGASLANSLALTSSGAIGNVAGASLAVTNNASFTGTSINLNSTNAMASLTSGTLTFNSGGAVAIRETGAVSLVGASTANSLILASTTSSIGDTAGATLAVTNLGTLTAATTINLGNSGGGNSINFGTLTFAGTAVQITEIDSMDLTGTSTASVSGVLIAGGHIFDTGGGAGVSGPQWAFQASTGVGNAGVNPLHTTNGALNVNLDAVTATGGVFVLNTGPLTITRWFALPNFVTVTDAVRVTAAGGITINAASPMTVSGDVISPGPIALTANGNGVVDNLDRLTVTDGVTIQSTGSSVTLTSGDDMTIGAAGAPLTTVSAATTLTLNVGTEAGAGSAESATLTIFDENMLAAGGNTILYTANSMNFNGTNTNTTGVVVLRPQSVGRAIDLGTKTAGTLGLTAAELNTITAGQGLRVGRNDIVIGNITISAPIAPAGTPKLTLITPGSITETAGTVTIASLEVLAGGPVTMGNDNTVTNLAANLTTSGDSLLFQEVAGTNLNVTTVSTAGFTTTAGITTNDGNVTLISDLLTVSNNITVNNSTLPSPLTTLTTPPIPAGAPTTFVWFQTRSTGQPINLGVGVKSGVTLDLTSAELNRVIEQTSLAATTGVLRIGGGTQSPLITPPPAAPGQDGNTAGLITVAGTISPTGVKGLSLKSGNALNPAGITEAGGAFINGSATLTDLALQSFGTINVSTGGLVANGFQNFAGLVSGAGNSITFVNSSALNITTVDDLCGVGTNNGDITITTNTGDLTVTHSAHLGFAPIRAGCDVDAGTAAVALTASAGNVVFQPGAAECGNTVVVTAAGDINITPAVGPIVGTTAVSLIAGTSGVGRIHGNQGLAVDVETPLLFAQAAGNVIGNPPAIILNTTGLVGGVPGGPFTLALLRVTGTGDAIVQNYNNNAGAPGPGGSMTVMQASTNNGDVFISNNRFLTAVAGDLTIFEPTIGKDGVFNGVTFTAGVMTVPGGVLGGGTINSINNGVQAGASGLLGNGDIYIEEHNGNLLLGTGDPLLAEGVPTLRADFDQVTLNLLPGTGTINPNGGAVSNQDLLNFASHFDIRTASLIALADTGVGVSINGGPDFLTTRLVSNGGGVPATYGHIAGSFRTGGFVVANKGGWVVDTITNADATLTAQGFATDTIVGISGTGVAVAFIHLMGEDAPTVINAAMVNPAGDIVIDQQEAVGEAGTEATEPFAASDDIQVTALGSITALAGGVTLHAADNISVLGPISATTIAELDAQSYTSNGIMPAGSIDNGGGVATSITIGGGTSVTAPSISLSTMNGVNTTAGTLGNGATVSVSITAGTGVNTPSAVALGNVNSTGTFTVNTPGAITQAGATSVIVGGLSTLNGSSVTLSNVTNDFGTVSSTSSGNVTLVDANDLVLGAVSVGGNLSATALAGPITQTVAGTVVVGGTTTLSAAGNNITLGNAGNNFVGNVRIASGNNITLRTLGALSVDSNVLQNTSFTLTAGGNVTDGGIGFGSTGATTINAGSFDVTLTNASDDFSTLAIGSARNVTVTSGASQVNPLNLGTSTISGFLSVNTAGSGQSITQSGALSVGGTSTFAAGAGSITLTNGGNQFIGALTASGANVSVTDNGSLLLGNVTVTGALAVTTNGTITQTGLSVVNVTGTTTLTANATNDIILSNGNSLGGAVTVTAARNVTLNDTVALVFGGASVVSGNLTATGAGINEGGAGTLSVAGTTTLTSTGGGNSIALGNANSFTGAVSATVAGAGNVTINDTIALLAGSMTMGGNLNLTGAGITENSGATLTVGGTTSLTAGAGNNITLANNTNSFTGAVTVVSGNNVSLFDTAPLTIAAGSVISGTTTLATSGGSGITVNASTLTGAVTASAGGNISITDVVTLPIGAAGVNAGGTATLTSGGNITDSAGGTVSGTTVTLTGTGANSNIGLSSATAVLTHAGTLNFTATGTGNVFITQNGTANVSGGVLGTGSATLVNTSGGWNVTGQIGSATANTVSMTASAGAITNGFGGNDFSANNLVLIGSTGVGTTGAITSQVNNLAGSGGVGGFVLTNTGNLTITTINGVVGVSDQAGPITITAASTINIDAPVTGAGDVTFNANEDVVSAGSDDNINVCSNVTSTTGNVIMTAADSIDVNAVISAAQNVTLTANFGNDPVEPFPNGGLFFSPGGQISGNVQNVTLNSNGDITLGTVIAINTVTVNSFHGSINIGGPGGANGNPNLGCPGGAAFAAVTGYIQAGSTVTLTAHDNINFQNPTPRAEGTAINAGTITTLVAGQRAGGFAGASIGATPFDSITNRGADLIDVTSQSVVATAGAIGNGTPGTITFTGQFQNLTNAGGTGGGPSEGAINISDNQDMIVGTVNSNAGVTLTSTAAIIGNAGVTNVTGTDLTATSAAGTSLTTSIVLGNGLGGNAVTATVSGAGAVNLTNNSGRTITLTNITTANGNVSVTNNGGIQIGSVSAAGNTVSLNATAGAITDFPVNGATDVTAAAALLQASAGVGTTGPIQLNARTVAGAGGAGVFNVREAGAGGLTVGTVNGIAGVTATGAVTIVAASPLEVAANVTSGASVTLTASASGGADDLTIDAAATVTAATSLTFTAGRNVNVFGFAVGGASSTITAGVGDPTGSVVDAENGISHVTLSAGTLTVSALGQNGNQGIALGTTVPAASLSVTGTVGGITVSNAATPADGSAALTVNTATTAATTANGTISLSNTGSAMTVTTATTVASNGQGNITVNSRGGNLTIGLLTANTVAANNTTSVTSAGSVTSNGAPTNVVSTSLVANSQTGVGPLNTSVSNVAGTGGTGGFAITNTASNVTVTRINGTLGVTAAGAITINNIAGGSITVANDIVGGGTVTLTSGEDGNEQGIVTNNGTTVRSTGANVILTSQDGGIELDGLLRAATDATVQEQDLDGDTDETPNGINVGVNGLIQSTTATLTARGFISARTLISTLTLANATAAGNITITNLSGNLAVTRAATAAGSINITAIDGSLTVADNLGAGAGGPGIFAGGAGSNVLLATQVGALNVGGSIVLGSVTAPAQVELESTGSVTRALGAGTAETNLTAATLLVVAPNGFATAANPMQTSIGTGAGVGTVAGEFDQGGFFMTDANDPAGLVIGTLTTTSGRIVSGIRDTNLANDLGGGAAIAITESSPLVVANNVITTGSITLTAQDSAAGDPADNLTVNTGVTVQSTQSSVTLTAGDNLTVSMGSFVTAGTTVTLNAGFPNEFPDDPGVATLLGTITAGTNGGPGTITVNAAGNIILGVFTGNGGTFNTTNGSILNGIPGQVNIFGNGTWTFNAPNGTLGIDTNPVGFLLDGQSQVIANVGGQVDHVSVAAFGRVGNSGRIFENVLSPGLILFNNAVTGGGLFNRFKTDLSDLNIRIVAEPGYFTWMMYYIPDGVYHPAVLYHWDASVGGK